MNDQLMTYLLKELQAIGATDVVLDFTSSKEIQIKFSNSTITGTYTWHSQSLSVFCSFERKLVSTNLHTFTKPGINKLVKTIKLYAKTLPVNKEFVGIAKGPFAYKPVPQGYDTSLAERDAELTQKVTEAISFAHAHGIKKTAGVLEGSTYERKLLSSNGCKGSEKGSALYFSFRAFADKQGSGHAVGYSRTLDAMSFVTLVQNAVNTALHSQDPVEIKPGSYDVVFSPLAFSCLLGNVGSALSAFSVESGMSAFQGKIGKKVGSSVFTLSDNGKLAQGYASSSFDDEGRPTKKTTLIDKGVLKTYLHNTSTAKRMNAKPTGNAGIISPSTTNLVLNKGKFSKEQLISQVKAGLYVTNLWYTRFQNYHTGDFSTIPRDGAFYIENGKIIAPVRGMRITENIVEILKKVKAVGNDLLPIKGWEAETPTLCPHVLVKKVTITKPTK